MAGNGKARLTGLAVEWSLTWKKATLLPAARSGQGLGEKAKFQKGGCYWFLGAEILDKQSDEGLILL